MNCKKRQTNFENIKNMTANQIAAFLMDIARNVDRNPEYKAMVFWKQWLESEVQPCYQDV